MSVATLSIPCGELGGDPFPPAGKLTGVLHAGRRVRHYRRALSGRVLDQLADHIRDVCLWPEDAPFLSTAELKLSTTVAGIPLAIIISSGPGEDALVTLDFGDHDICGDLPGGLEIDEWIGGSGFNYQHGINVYERPVIVRTHNQAYALGQEILRVMTDVIQWRGEEPLSFTRSKGTRLVLGQVLRGLDQFDLVRMLTSWGLPVDRHQMNRPMPIVHTRLEGVPVAITLFWQDTFGLVTISLRACLPRGPGTHLDTLARLNSLARFARLYFDGKDDCDVVVETDLCLSGGVTVDWLRENLAVFAHALTFITTHLNLANADLSVN
jgi:hypothetical protein